MVIFEGDLIRPLGLVTLYAAYAEYEIDELILVLPSKQKFDEIKQQWPVGKKLAYAQKLVNRLKTESLSGLNVSLKEAGELFKRRNTLVHGCIFAGGRLVSNRRSTPVQWITPDELNELAERIFTCKEYICMYRNRHLLPLLETLEVPRDT